MSVAEVADPIEEESPLLLRRKKSRVMLCRERISSLKRKNSDCKLRLEVVMSAAKEYDDTKSDQNDSPLRQLSKEKLKNMWNREVKVNLSQAFCLSDRYGVCQSVDTCSSTNSTNGRTNSS